MFYFNSKEMNLLLRITILIICVVTCLNAFIFVGISAYESIQAYSLIFQGRVEERPEILIGRIIE